MVIIVNPFTALGVPDWIWDTFALLLTILFIVILIRIIRVLRKREIVPDYMTSKLFMMFFAPVFVICWLLFSGGFYSRYMVAALPGLFLFVYILVATDSIKGEEFKQTVSPDGTSRGLMKVPLFYTLLMGFAALYLWYVPLDSIAAPIYSLFIPTALLIFGPLAGGSNFSNLIHNRYGKHKFKVFTEKSIEGSLAMYFCSLIFTFGLLGIYWLLLGQVFNSFNIITLVVPVFIVSGISTVVELLSPQNYETIWIPVVAFFTIFIIHLIGFYPFFVVFPFRIPFVP